MQGIKDEPSLTLQIIATGMHLSAKFGNTYQEIEGDGFAIDRKVQMLTGSDTPVGIAKSMGNGLIGFADALNELKPDLIVVLGDRFEIFSVVAAALWMIKNPNRGFLLPDDIDHEEILKTSMPYISPFVSKAVDWTPLKNLNTKFTKFDIARPKDEDVWQFTTFLVDPRERLNAYDARKE